MVHSRCVQVRREDIVSESVSVLSTKSVDGEIPLVLIPTPRNTASMFLTVPTGVACLMQRFGKAIEEEASPGLHLLPSYYRIAYVVSKQACTYDAPVRSCPTSDDVRVNIDVVIIFQIVKAHTFIYNLGVKNFDEYLRGTVDEAIRMLVRKETHKTIYSLRGENANVMLKLLNEKFEPYGVDFKNVKVTSVWLPPALAQALEETTMMEKKMDRLMRQNEYEVLQIKQESVMRIEEINRKSEQVLISEAGRKRRAELEFEQRSVKAEEEGSVGLIEANGKCDVNALETKTQLDRTKTQLETYRVRETAKSEASANLVKMKADLAEEEASIAASWQQEQMICDAKATTFEAAAEEEASECLKEKRRHELEIREKAILTKLAEQGNFNLVGSTGDKLIEAMMTGSFKN